MRRAFEYRLAIFLSARAKAGRLRFAVAKVSRIPVSGSTMQKMFAVPQRTYS